VPPPAYGGIESVVSLVTDYLVQLGHEVTLYATGDSLTMARLRAVRQTPLRSAGIDRPGPYELVHIATLLAEANEYDVIHNHCGEQLMAFSNVISTPILTTVHGPMPVDADVVWQSYRGYYNSISRASRNGFPDKGYVGIVYNGIDVESFPLRTNKEDYLLFLGRISEEKGTHVAIDVAQALGLTLIVAGKVDRADVDYYERMVRPRIDGLSIVYVGEADSQQKRELFGRARCLLHPVTWPEPFGLVMAEAMACGTPVVAMRQGSIPEVVLDGQTGFVVDSVDQMIDAVSRVGSIDPLQCREHVSANFSLERMGSSYERILEMIWRENDRGGSRSTEAV
jgi:glycosyltransferase involved in cell wall biosynthesis